LSAAVLIVASAAPALGVTGGILQVAGVALAIWAALQQSREIAKAEKERAEIPDKQLHPDVDELMRRWKRGVIDDSAHAQVRSEFEAKIARHNAAAAAARQSQGERVSENLIRQLFKRWDLRISLILILSGLVLQTLSYFF